MDQLYSLLDNWSKSTGMSAVIVDTEGNRTSGSFGMTDGQVLGRVLAGQALSDDQDEEEIVRKAVSFGIDEAEVRRNRFPPLLFQSICSECFSVCFCRSPNRLR